MRGSQSGQFVIPANGRVPIMGQGQFIRCLEANGVFTVSVNNGQENYFASGISYTAPEFEDYTEFALINRTAAPVTVIISWGFGTVTDNRLTATGNLFVINAPATTLKVDDDETQVSLAAILSMMQDNNSQKKPLNSLAGCSYARANNATVVAVTAAANVNGIRIRHAILANGHNLAAGLFAGANALMMSNFNALPQQIENLIIPAGVKLELVSPGISGDVICWYEVL